MENRLKFAYGFLIACAAARLALQMIAMPPYAGLDEVYHVARLAFVRAEHRNPTTRERSFPRYLAASAVDAPEAMPAFGELGARWPDVVRARGGRVIADRPLTLRDLKPYVVPNYEAQQTSLYYSLAASAVPFGSALFELRAWRAMSVLFALITVIAVAEIGRRWLGPAGILGAALLVSFPTWLTLVVRASNDALACMLVAVAIAISISDSRKAAVVMLEAAVWALAIDAKLYTWPLAVVLPLFWWRQRAAAWRVVAVTAACATSAVLVFAELMARTSNALGVVAFDRPGGPMYDASVNLGELIRVTIASAAWTSGQHFDALRPWAIALYLGPLLVAVVAWSRGLGAVSRSPHPETARPRDLATTAFAVLAVFALTQAANVVACLLARRGGNPVPIGGKEGWYWYVLMPVVMPALIAPALARWRPLAWWIVMWDLVITECALFHDYAGTSSPLHPSILFRWGPLHLPFTAHLAQIGVGPLAAWTTAVRLLHLGAFGGLESILQRMRQK